MFSNKRSCKRSSFKCLFDFYLFQFESFVMIQSFLFFSRSQREILITYIFFRESQQILQIGIERVWNLWLNHVNTFSNTNIWTLNSRNLIAMLRSNLNMKPLIVIINTQFFFFFFPTKACKNSSPSTGKLYNTKLLYLTLHFWQIVKKIEEANVRKRSLFNFNDQVYNFTIRLTVNIKFIWYDIEK